MEPNYLENQSEDVPEKYREEPEYVLRRLPRFKVGDLVIESEKICDANRSFPMKVVEVIKASYGKTQKYCSGHQYRLEAYFEDHRNFFLHDQIFFEEGLRPFREGRDDMIGALYSRIQDLQELGDFVEERY